MGTRLRSRRPLPGQSAAFARGIAVAAATMAARDAPDGDAVAAATTGARDAPGSDGDGAVVSVPASLRALFARCRHSVLKDLTPDPETER